MGAQAGRMTILDKQIAIYTRVSTADKGQSTEMQVQDLLQFAHSKGLAVTKIYEDKGYSGSSSSRPQLNQLLEDVRAGNVSHILVWRLDRWFRSLKEIVLTLGELNERGIVFISLKDGIDMSTSTGMTDWLRVDPPSLHELTHPVGWS